MHCQKSFRQERLQSCSGRRQRRLPPCRPRHTRCGREASKRAGLLSRSINASITKWSGSPASLAWRTCARPATCEPLTFAAECARKSGLTSLTPAPRRAGMRQVWLGSPAESAALKPPRERSCTANRLAMRKRDWPATCVVNGNVTASLPGRSGAEAPVAQFSRMYSVRWNEAGEGWPCCNGQAGYAHWADPAGPIEPGAAPCRSSRSWEQVCPRCLQTSKR